MSDTIRADLRRQIGSKLRCWAKDSIALYEMADIGIDDASYDVFVCAVLFVARGAIVNDMEPAELGHMMRRQAKEHNKYLKKTFKALKKAER